MILCGCYDSENELSSRMLHKILSCIAEESKKILIEKRHVPKILIHCTAGISRSSTIAIAYLAQLLGITHQDAYERVKSKRRIIKPNDGFKALLGITLLP
jgi:protein-tyrosine phosphatase